MINPTGGAIRNDSEGHGHYGARRGSRLHLGTDYELKWPNQPVVAPISGVISRRVYAYVNDPQWQGLEIIGRRATVKLLYVLVDNDLIGKEVQAGDVIGTAQDISQRYNPAMAPHVHLEITSLDPECLVEI